VENLHEFFQICQAVALLKCPYGKGMALHSTYPHFKNKFVYITRTPVPLGSVGGEGIYKLIYNG